MKRGICCAGTLLIHSSLACGELLRLSKVAGGENANTERFELTNGDKREVLFVEKQAIITGADVKSAMRSPQQAHALAVMLTDGGGKKLGAATNDAHGDMRIAILINGEVVTAPTVNMKLGKHFIIEGLKEYPDDDLDLLGWQIEGKNDEEIAKLLHERKIIQLTPPPPRPELEYYTDEEYAVLKEERKKMGMFYLDQLPTEEELNKRLKAGMRKDAVIAEFGNASRTTHEDGDLVVVMEYDLAPEKQSLIHKWRPDSFKVELKQGKVVSWRISSWTDTPRQAKPQGKNLRRLNAKFPGQGLADPDFGTARWIEGIELFLKTDCDKPHIQDYADLIGLIYNQASMAEESEAIEANCSVVKTLAEGFPDVEELRKTAKNGKISLTKLGAVVEPYMTGEKQFPESIVDPE